jgi:hypothetical protein
MNIPTGIIVIATTITIAMEKIMTIHTRMTTIIPIPMY